MPYILNPLSTLNMVALSGNLLLWSSFLILQHAKAQSYSATYLPSNAPDHSEAGQSGTNKCGVGLNQTSNCQNAYRNISQRSSTNNAADPTLPYKQLILLQIGAYGLLQNPVQALLLATQRRDLNDILMAINSLTHAQPSYAADRSCMVHPGKDCDFSMFCPVHNNRFIAVRRRHPITSRTVLAPD